MATGISSTSEMEKRAGQTGEAEREHTVAEREQTGGITLRALLDGVSLRSQLPQGELQIRHVANDSRKVRPGALFVAIHGVATDGNLFAKDCRHSAALLR